MFQRTIHKKRIYRVNPPAVTVNPHRQWVAGFSTGIVRKSQPELTRHRLSEVRFPDMIKWYGRNRGASCVPYSFCVEKSSLSLSFVCAQV